jgi:hypothetical protein
MANTRLGSSQITEKTVDASYIGIYQNNYSLPTDADPKDWADVVSTETKWSFDYVEGSGYVWVNTNSPISSILLSNELPKIPNNRVAGTSNKSSKSDHDHGKDASKLDITVFNTYKDTTVPNTYVTKTNAVFTGPVIGETPSGDNQQEFVTIGYLDIYLQDLNSILDNILGD